MTPMTNTGLGHLSVWISDLDEKLWVSKHCNINQRPRWYVSIYNCDDEIVKVCGVPQAILPTKCGHLEVDLPPGCYRVSAVWSAYQSGGAWYGNHFTDSALVDVCCNEATCVKLYVPVIHRCGIIYTQALKDLVLAPAPQLEAAAPDLGAAVAAREFAALPPQQQINRAINFLDVLTNTLAVQAGNVEYVKALKAEVTTKLELTADHEITEQKVAETTTAADTAAKDRIAALKAAKIAKAKAERDEAVAEREEASAEEAEAIASEIIANLELSC